MAPKNTAQKHGIFATLKGAAALRAEKAQMEAFLAAFPGEYCGWAPDGTLAYSEGFCRALGLEQIKTLQDIQARLSASDAMALEGLFTRLQDKGEMFCMTARTADRARSLKLCGTRGADRENTARFHILWLEDMTGAVNEMRRLEEAAEQGRKETERLQLALDQMPVPLWMRNLAGDMVWCNRAYAALLETSPASVIAEQREFQKTARQATSAKMLAQSALESEQPQIMQTHIVSAGVRHRLEIQERPLPNMGMTLGLAQDLTPLEELETEQRRQGTAHKELLEHLGSAIAIFNADQKIEFFNSAFARLWQVEERWLHTGPKLGDIMEKLRETRRLPEQADFRRFKQSWLALFTGLIGTHEEMLYLPDGKALRMLVIPHPLGGLMMTFEDVTGTLALESSYNTLIAVQRETLDNLAEGVVVFGSDGRIKLWNPAFARLWALNPETLSGEPHITTIVDRMKNYFADSAWGPQRDILIGLGLARRELTGRIGRADGSLIDYVTMPLSDGGVLMAQQDVTNSVQVETALRDRNSALETAEQLKLDFLANVSYQLRTPLNAIMGFAEILDKQYFGPLNPRQQEYTTGLQQAGGRLVGLIDDILDLSTLEAGYLALDREPVDIHALLRTMETMVRDWAGTRKILVRVETAPGTGRVDGDPRRLKQVMLNLIRNAIAFTPEGGIITLRAAREGDQIAFGVSDTGPGIAPEDQKKIFEPFNRLDAKSATPGAGLGLSLVKNIIALHNGRVELDSAPGNGTTVSVLLPALD